MSESIKPIVYTLRIRRPDPDYSGPERRPNETREVEFNARTPFPVPRVGEEIERQTTFGDYGARAQTRCRISRVQHGVIESREEMIYTITVWTEELT
jgi:hypothetical protein